MGFSAGHFKANVRNNFLKDNSLLYRHKLGCYYIFHFMRAFKSVFVLIRAYPEAEYNIALLKVLQKYIAQVEQLNNVGITSLKNDIKDTEGIEWELKADLKSL